MVRGSWAIAYAANLNQELSVSIEMRKIWALCALFEAASQCVERPQPAAYERHSLIVTTNLQFEHWTEVLGSERLTGAALDPLTHRCHILETKGESYRLKDARRRRRSNDKP